MTCPIPVLWDLGAGAPPVPVITLLTGTQAINASATLALTLTDINVAAGSLIAVAVSGFSTNATWVVTVSDGVNPGNYSSVSSGFSVYERTFLFYVLNSLALVNRTITVGFTGFGTVANGVAMSALSATNAVTLDTAVTASATGTTTAVSVTSGIPVTGGELFIGANGGQWAAAGLSNGWVVDSAHGWSGQSSGSDAKSECYLSYQVNPGTSAIINHPALGIASTDNSGLIVGFIP